jgi:hypothetical protein
MAVERDQLYNELPKKRNYDKLYLDITLEVLQKMIADAVAKGNKITVKQLDDALKLVVVERNNYDKT